MKSKITLFTLLFLSVLNLGYSRPLDRLIERVDNRDRIKLIDFFHRLEPMEFDDAKELIRNLYSHYGKEMKPLKGELYKILRSLPPCYIQFPNLISLFKDHRRFMVLQCQRILYITDLLIDPNSLSDDTIPSNLIICGVEVLTGSLICMLPFPNAPTIGSVLIADGTRRALSQFNEFDVEAKQHWKRRRFSD